MFGTFKKIKASPRNDRAVTGIILLGLSVGMLFSAYVKLPDKEDKKNV